MRDLPQIRGTDSPSRRPGSKPGGSACNRPERDDPNATDPLFRPLDADDGADDFTLLRTRALFKVRVPLPSRVRLTDDPLATHVTLSRAVSPLNMLKHTAPYQQDRSAGTLEAQALAAVNQHMEPTIQPSAGVPRERGRVPASHLLVGEGAHALGGHRPGARLFRTSIRR